MHRAPRLPAEKSQSCKGDTVSPPAPFPHRAKQKGVRVTFQTILFFFYYYYLAGIFPGSVDGVVTSIAKSCGDQKGVERGGGI